MKRIRCIDMSQEEILEVLKENDLTRKEIQKKLRLNQQAISHALKMLLKYQEIIIINFIDSKQGSNVPVYALKKEKGGKPPKK